jgi:energy-coupling factor transporter ATP-binding protein EcfA2
MANTNIKNILLIGRTGNGKSTLANVITGTDKFKESSGTVSETRNIEIEEFEDNITRDGSEKVRYRVIDTIGIGDTQLTPREVLRRIQEGSKYIENGLSQILFVTNGRFTEEERNAYNLLRSIIFDNEVVKYTTIIRTNFPEFENENVCERDREAIKKENKENFDITNSVKIVYVDNPPINTGNVRRDSINIETREVSRERLLTLLVTFQGIYNPANLSDMNERINNYKTETEKLEGEIKERDRKMNEQSKLFQEKIDELNKNQTEKMQSISNECERKIKEAKEEADRKIKEAQSQGNLSEKLLELIERNRADSEERAREDKKYNEKKMRDSLKEKEDGLRREMELQRQIDELKRKGLEDKQKELEDEQNKKNEEYLAQIEEANKRIKYLESENRYVQNNYKKKGGCNIS